MLKAAKLIKQKINAQFIVAKPRQTDWGIYDRIIAKFDIEVKFVEGNTYDALNIADFALVCSGTATLETAIMQKPFLIVYKMSLLNYLLYRPQVKIPYIGIVNIVAGRSIIPEYIQFQAKPAKIAKKALDLLNNRVELRMMQNELAAVKASLGQPGAAHRAARIVIDFLGY